MSDEAAFIQEILANPADRECRLIFADWLEEQGDARGELIRLQVQLEGMAPDEKGYSTVRKKVRSLEKTVTMFGQLPSQVSKWEHRCGFIEQIELTLTAFLKHAEDIFANNPVQHAVLRAKSAKLDKIAELPQLAKLRSLELRENRLGNDGLKKLVGAPQMRSLERLTIYSNDITSEGIRELASMKNLGELRELRILNNVLDEGAVEALATSSVIKKLTRLELLGVFSNRTWQLLARSDGLRSLTHLLLDSRGTEGMLSASGLQEFGQSAFEKPLEELTLTNCIENGIGKGFANTPRLASLKKLDISWCDLQDSDVQDLVENLPPVEVLRLEENSIGDDGAKTLAGSPLLETLQKLYLTGNIIKLDGVLALSNSPHRQKKTKFYLGENPLTDKEIKQVGETVSKSFGNFGRPPTFRAPNW